MFQPTFLLDYIQFFNRLIHPNAILPIVSTLSILRSIFYTNGITFPGRLSVENGRIWLDKGLRPIREIPWEDLGGLRYDRAGECYILYDKQEKTLAKFSTRDAFGSRFLNLLTDHDIRIQK